MRPVIQVKRMNETAKMPVYAHPEDVGADVCSNEPNVVVIRPEQRVLIHTGLKVAIQPGYELQVRSKSGIALKAGVFVLNSPGTIEENYRGEIGVILHNTSHESFVVEPGTKVAQIVCKPVYQADFVEVDELDETDRGEGGFGSTGLKEETANDISK